MKSFSYLLIRIVIGFTFIISGLLKLFSLNYFTEIVYSMHVLPIFFVPYFAILLPIIEYVLGAFLIFGLSVKLTAKCIILLLISFTIVISINLIKGNLIDCGCFGNILQEKIGWSLLLREVIILFGTLFIAFPEGFYKYKVKLQRVIFQNLKNKFGDKN